ncbi:MAG: hypothetical protein HYV95_04625 [Opitutae bacterium]|nr:hypothetical protein [Opitutae bacterium]
MANWEYKVISSGKGGFASPALMEKFINDLGQEQWEIIGFQTAPDNSLAFTGLARRPTQRDWTLEDAAAAAARAEADKLRAEFEAKFKAGTSGAAATAEEDKAETFLAEERTDADGSLRRLRDTSRDDDPDAAEDESAPKDEWDKLAAEDELPTFFDALRPHMRRNQRGPGMSVGVDFLAKKWRLEESDIKGALVECGLQIPADENAKPVYVEYEGELFWVNINRRGEIWINLRDKPEPVFRIVQGKRLSDEEAAAENVPVNPPAPRAEERRRDDRQENRGRAPQPQPVPAESGAGESAPAPQAPPAAPRTFLGKIRGMMRRNRRGHGWSGSFPFLTKALKTDEAGLLAQLAEQGLKLQPEGEQKPAFHEEGEFLYWLQKNQRGEIWINARKARKSENGELQAEDGDTGADEGGDAASAGSPAPAAAQPAELPPPSPANTLAAVRLLLQPKKRGEGCAALVPEVAAQLGQSEDKLLAALTAAGLNVPEDAKAKPTFGEHGGEIFWLNRNTKDELWLNAKLSKSAAAKKSRPRKKSDEAAAD